MTPLDRCAEAIVETYLRYELEVFEGGMGLVVDRSIYDPDEGFMAPWPECRMWIAQRAARACLEALLPVDEGMVEAMREAAASGVSRISPDLMFTAAIRHAMGCKA